jgi:hypothetical protein
MPFIRRNIVWFAGLTPVTLASVNILGLSAGDPEVFGYLVQNLDLPRLIVGIVIQLIPAAILFMGFAWWDNEKWRPRADNLTEWRRRTRNRLIFFPLMFIVCLFMQVFWLGAAIISIAIVYLERRDSEKHYLRTMRRYGIDVPLKVRSPLMEGVRAFPFLFLLFAFIWAAMPSNSTSIPAESMQVNGESTPIIGRVISSDEMWTTILLVPIGPVRVVTTGNISARSPCSIRFQNSVGGMLNHLSPRCPGF